ncbi:MAG: glycosyltransferase family 4 protein [Candidatus Odinarchaeum yellowstonii]|uniref:Glycosyltransferase family 4 protein n=1 Tax=Odinarchaeota yellowstonii (strain LCB_4) TaxID=1841599 RepID=A0AAF0D153_ODILC|nr:MAG: glycosyltransferase family 4 protein [Candidatus Odinarchaeum yellowstonii]
MRILMVLDKFFPSDIRVEKEARALLNAGNEVFLLSMGKNDLAEREDVNGVKVIRLKPAPGLLNRIKNWLHFTFLFIYPSWRRAVEKIIDENRIDVVHVHDLKMVKTCLKPALKKKIPIIADLHENFPEALKIWRSTRKFFRRLIANITSPIWRWRRLEKKVLQQVTKIITVVEEGKKHYIEDCKISEDKITVIMNTEDIEYFNRISVENKILEKYKGFFVLTYIGGIAKHRGVESLIKAMPLILNKIPKCKLLLIGFEDEKYLNTLLNMSIKLGVSENIEFIKWVNFNLVPTYIRLSNICFVPHLPSAHTNTTIPHKLFQYMVFSKPVIVSDAKPLKRIVEECQCGISVNPYNYNEVAEAVIKIYSNEKLAYEYGVNGRKAVEEKYNWSVEAKKLISLYEQLR